MSDNEMKDQLVDRIAIQAQVLNLAVADAEADRYNSVLERLERVETNLRMIRGLIRDMGLGDATNIGD